MSAVLPLPRKCCSIVTSNGHRVYWQPNVTGDWSTDCDTGRGYASNVIEYVVEQRKPELLFQIIREMVQRGSFGGCEAGFIQSVVDCVV